VWAAGGPQYDRLPPRQFEFVPLWGIAVFFLYLMRRVDCAKCGVRVEQVPWADGEPVDHDLPVVSRPLGEAPQLA
jgi:hypothetical protein